MNCAAAKCSLRLLEAKLSFSEFFRANSMNSVVDFAGTKGEI